MKHTQDALPERIRSKIASDPGSHCWVWIGAVSSGGYGKVYWGRPQAAAHRVVYKLLVDDEFVVFPGYGPRRQLDHTCRNRRCVNPDHLRVVSNRQNVSAGLSGALGEKTSRAIGVSLIKETGKWGVSFWLDGRLRHIGRCVSEAEAAQRYDAARLLIEGDTPNAEAGLCDPPTPDLITVVAKRLGVGMAA